MNTINKDSNSKIHNLIRLSDSIFALAMALTILGFDLPDTALSMSDSEINSFLHLPC